MSFQITLSEILSLDGSSVFFALDRSYDEVKGQYSLPNNIIESRDYRKCLVSLEYICIYINVQLHRLEYMQTDETKARVHYSILITVAEKGSCRRQTMTFRVTPES